MIRYHRICVIYVTLLVLSAAPASAVCYKYLDDNGIVHFTDNPDTIPEKYQSQINQVTGLTDDRKTNEARGDESTGELSSPDKQQAAQGSKETGKSETAEENSQKQHQSTGATSRLTESKTEAGSEVQNIEIKKLTDKRKTLLGKKDELNKKFDALIKEKKRLEAGRKNLDDETRIKEYNQNVKRINEKIKKYKEEETALRREIEDYNKSLTRPSPP